MNEQTKERPESDILFSRSVKAGKRIYYVDVKQDRHNELYLSITESKRIKDGNEESRPVFEKHKIFLYSEDLERFSEAFNAAAEYARCNSADVSHRCSGDYYSESQFAEAQGDNEESVSNDELHKPTTEFRLDIDF